MTTSAKILALTAMTCTALLAQAQSDPSFDHQVKTYSSSFQPLSLQNAKLTLTPFFSPDHSIDTLVDLINGAKVSLDIQTPGVSSWIGCSFGTSCIGCAASKMTTETFSAFPALLNAVHRGVTVRIITNNYNDQVCNGEIDIITFFALNQIQIKWYQVGPASPSHAPRVVVLLLSIALVSCVWRAPGDHPCTVIERHPLPRHCTPPVLRCSSSAAHGCTAMQSTTFVHSKYVMVDSTLASVSSVNWSPNSFTNNREAGLLVKGAGAAPVLKFLTSVFDADWSAGATFTPAQTYSSSDMKIITDLAVRQVVVPQGPTNRSYVTPNPSPITDTVANFTVLTSPDWSYSTIMDAVNAATKSVQIYIYQITDPRVCNAVQALHKRLDLTLLVSKAIYDATDQARLLPSVAAVGS
jgi:phosphatidylserine/phosphatidylglycerophosphate/cardiolipin synthase-like enzyme